MNASPTGAIGAITVRDSQPSDMAAVQRIYAHYVTSTLSTFEETPPTVAEIAVRRDDVLSLGLPFLVGECEGAIVGYAYAGRYRPRSAYRFTVEDSVYVADGFIGSGIGSALLSTLIARCDQGPWRQMIAVIGDSGTASIALHQKLGFARIGTLRAVGFKHGRWVDTVLMQRPLHLAASAPPL